LESVIVFRPKGCNARPGDELGVNDLLRPAGCILITILVIGDAMIGFMKPTVLVMMRGAAALAGANSSDGLGLFHVNRNTAADARDIGRSFRPENGGEGGNALFWTWFIQNPRPPLVSSEEV
jgi:hypothetical protein